MPESIPINNVYKLVPYIYLWVSEDATEPNIKPVTQIAVKTSDDPITADGTDGRKYVKWQNTNEPANCNEDAGGKYIYIKYR